MQTSVSTTVIKAEVPEPTEVTSTAPPEMPSVSDFVAAPTPSPLPPIRSPPPVARQCAFSIPEPACPDSDVQLYLICAAMLVAGYLLGSAFSKPSVTYVVEPLP
jgi:hypothetical protein